jgi:hypothetical protein
MAREPQPRTSSMSVQEADAKGLVRNSLIDSPQNWDSLGKQKLRKGFLQTLDASEKYINEGPLGQSVGEWDSFYNLYLCNKQKYLTDSISLLSDGTVAEFKIPLEDIGELARWQIKGEIIFDGNMTDGTVSLTSSVPADNSVWTCSLQTFNPGDNPIWGLSSLSLNEGPLLSYPDTDVYLFKFNWFLTLNSTASMVDLNFNFNGVGMVNIIESSWMENRLLYEAYAP